MKDEGWTYGDLAGELMCRGIDIDDVCLNESILSNETPERAAREIENKQNGYGG